jgi:hypothetical protein
VWSGPCVMLMGAHAGARVLGSRSHLVEERRAAVWRERELGVRPEVVVDVRHALHAEDSAASVPGGDVEHCHLHHQEVTVRCVH